MEEIIKGLEAVLEQCKADLANCEEQVAIQTKALNHWVRCRAESAQRLTEYETAIEVLKKRLEEKEKR